MGRSVTAKWRVSEAWDHRYVTQRRIMRERTSCITCNQRLTLSHSFSSKLIEYLREINELECEPHKQICHLGSGWSAPKSAVK
jgi:hypothetical protein